MNSQRVRVAVNGYGVIGKRVADAIRLQPDMDLVGVSDIVTDYRLRTAAVLDIPIYAALREQAAFDNARRWMGWDLLCGRVVPGHDLWQRLCDFGFEARLRALFPTIGELHPIVLGQPLALAHVLENAALALQAQAGCQVAFGHTTRTTDEGVYQVAVQYTEEAVGRRAMKLAEQLIAAGRRADESAAIVERGTPAQVIDDPQNPRTQSFLSKVL